MPFYVHQAVKALRASGAPPSITTVTRLLDEALVAAVHTWEFAYYRSRIDEHYTAAQRPMALALLDAACQFSSGGDTVARLLRLGRVRVPGWDDEAVRSVVTLLERDHYLVRTTDGRIAFRHRLVQRWWLAQRAPA